MSARRIWVSLGLSTILVANGALAVAHHHLDGTRRCAQGVSGEGHQAAALHDDALPCPLCQYLAAARELPRPFHLPATVERAFSIVRAPQAQLPPPLPAAYDGRAPPAA